MLVPAIAFSWWLASVPMAPNAPHHVSPTSLAPTQAHTLGAVRATGSSPSTDVDETPDRALHVSKDATEQPADDENDKSETRILYRGLITPAIAAQARTYLDLPMGAERTADVEGHHFVFVLQRHYHPPGFVGAPTGWHKGVTVFEIL